MTQIISHPIPDRRALTLRMMRWAAAVAGAFLLFGITAGLKAHPTVRVLSAVDPPRPPRSWLSNRALLTVYGRAFGTAPILGRLGMDKNFADVARQVEPHRQAIAASGGGQARIAIHLIYGLATPCSTGDTCLLYLDESGVDIVKDYILPAARRGWLVILDDQLSRSNPVAEIERMLARGYLQYDNVEVALDPEFRMLDQGQTNPGSPVGSVTGAELNRAQNVLNEFGANHHLAHRKLLLVHEWTAGMIEHPERIRHDYSYVQTCIIMDGIGSPRDKASVYTDLIAPLARRHGLIPGIKIFPPSPFAPAGAVDTPTLNWKQLFDSHRGPLRDGDSGSLHPSPQIVVLT